MPSLPARTITGPFSCPAWLVLWVICGARFCDVVGVFSTLSLLTFPVSALVSAALWVKVRTSKFVLGRFSANLDDVGLSPLMFLPRNVRARRGDLWPFSSPHHASCGLSHNLVSFPVSCSVFGEPNLAIGVITLCIFAPATFCTFHPWEIPQSSLRDSESQTSRTVIYFLLLACRLSNVTNCAVIQGKATPPLVKVQKSQSFSAELEKLF